LIIVFAFFYGVDQVKILSELTDEEKQGSGVRHALQVRTAVAVGDYHALFRLYHEAPQMSVYLMDFFVCICFTSSLFYLLFHLQALYFSILVGGVSNRFFFTIFRFFLVHSPLFIFSHCTHYTHNCFCNTKIDRERLKALRAICRAYRPYVAVSFIASELGWVHPKDDEDERNDAVKSCRLWLKELGDVPFRKFLAPPFYNFGIDGLFSFRRGVA
jgi:hypothetical protein